MDHYLFLSSDDSKDLHPGNTFADFTIELPRPLFLEGDWVCALRDVKFSDLLQVKTLYVCTDLIQESLACDTYSPVLRTIHKQGKKALTFTDSYYVKVKGDRVQRLRIFIRGERLAPLESEEGSTVSCTLHLKRL